MVPGAAEENGEAGTNEYRVRVNQGAGGWDVEILRPEGSVAYTRSCSNEVEARTFASTVQQHIYWLSPEKFAEYYRLQGAEA
ncbi:MAG: hypothetical protein M3N24_08120 [Actinomycetota bacterium]|nr:hypothetical protein [Actinomycetota bacterium]